MSLFAKPSRSRSPASHSTHSSAEDNHSDYSNAFIEENNGIVYCTDETSCIYAYDAQTKAQVGKLEVSEVDDLWLEHVDVDSGYRRRGIGSHLMRLANDHFGGFLVACVQEADAYEFSLTDAGEALVASCVNAGILKQDQLRFSGSVPLADDASGDPGYDCLSLSQYRTGSPVADSPRSSYSCGSS